MTRALYQLCFLYQFQKRLYMLVLDVYSCKSSLLGQSINCGLTSFLYSIRVSYYSIFFRGNKFVSYYIVSQVLTIVGVAYGRRLYRKIKRSYFLVTIYPRIVYLYCHINVYGPYRMTTSLDSKGKNRP